MNGECLVFILSEFVCGNYLDHFPYVINSIMEEYNPAFYKKHPNVGETLKKEFEKYRKRYLQNALEKTDVYDALFTLRDKLEATFTINNDNIPDKQKNLLLDGLIENTDIEQQNFLNKVLSLKRANKLFNYASYREMDMTDYDFKPNILYNYDSGLIEFLPSFSLVFQKNPPSLLSSPAQDVIRQKIAVDFFIKSVAQRASDEVANHYSLEESEKSMNYPDTAKNYITKYKAFLIDLIVQVNDEASKNHLMKSSAFNDFFTGDIAKHFLDDPLTFVSYLECNFQVINNIEKDEKIGFFPTAVLPEFILKPSAAFLDAARNENLKPISLHNSFFANSLLGFMEEEKTATMQKLEGEDIANRKEAFKVFDHQVYTRKGIVQVLNSLGEGRMARFMRYIKENPNKIFFKDPCNDSFEDVKFIDLFGGAAKYSNNMKVENDELKKKRDLERNKKHLQYLTNTLNNSFGRKFTQSAKNQIIEMLLQDPNVYELVEAISGVTTSNRPFFQNPEVIFIRANYAFWNGGGTMKKLIFSMPTKTKNEYLEACKGDYESYKNNGCFANIGRAEQCSDGEGTYLVRIENKIESVNPTNTPKPNNVDKNQLANCANLVAEKPVIARHGLDNVLIDLQNCVKNDPYATSILSGMFTGKFTVEVYQQDASLDSKEMECQFSSPILDCNYIR